MGKPKGTNDNDQQAGTAAANAAKQRGWKAYSDERGAATEWRHKDYGVIVLSGHRSSRRQWNAYPKRAGGACVPCNLLEKAFTVCEEAVSP